MTQCILLGRLGNDLELRIVLFEREGQRDHDRVVRVLEVPAARLCVHAHRGDTTQVDLPSGQLSGLVEASEVLDGVEGVAVCRLTSADVVRHPLVQRVVEAYAKRDSGKVSRSMHR